MIIVVCCEYALFMHYYAWSCSTYVRYLGKRKIWKLRFRAGILNFVGDLL